MKLSVIKQYLWTSLLPLIMVAIIPLSGCIYSYEKDHPPRETWKSEARLETKNSNNNPERTGEN
jgi:hypothetical protein